MSDYEENDEAEPGDEPREDVTAPVKRRSPGRPRGKPNNSTILMRTAISAVFEDLQARHEGDGRYPHFLAWAEENPTEFYKLAARRLPIQIEANSRTVGLVVFKGLNE
jgi:hypothetical protein